MLVLPTLLCALPLVLARPTGLAVSRADNDNSTAPPTTVSAQSAAAAFVRPAQFASLVYCDEAKVNTSNVDTILPGVEILQTGGNDGTVPLYFVAHDPDTQSIVLAHQGTDVQNILSVANDIKFALVDLSSRFNTSGHDNVQVHQGFQEAFERTADSMLKGVTDGLASKNVSKVLVAGHSLGAAVATMSALFLKQQLPSNVELTTTVFGLPRGGNQGWADLVSGTLGASNGTSSFTPNSNANTGAFTFITNQHDPVPSVPPQFLGYVHPAGEVHIEAVDSAGNATTVVACPGQENENCSEGNSILQVDVKNHIGPYFQNISMSGKNCPLGAN
ncbi:hypothetical protein PLICRDRAFT_44456 [Plicaturopsis crispa FD-325 SS-3]|nr:hypothetical protein PLICRDRAFT_44456 [Plicaturopsis crispa FD-325 SS-3]